MARPVDDEDDEPRRPAKKPVRDEDAVQKGAPAKKPARRPVDEEDDYEEEEERRPRKKVSRRDEDVDEEPASLRDNTLLNMLFPVGVSIWALSSNYLGVFGLLLAIFGGAVAAGLGMGMLGYILPGIGGFMGLLAIPLGGLSFILRPKKTTYGGVTGYMRAIIGIICGLLAIIAAIAVPLALRSLFPPIR
jgi:hypothetical protein